MVQLHVKKGDDSQFLFDTTINIPTAELLTELLEIYNGRLKIERIGYEMSELGKHGTFYPPNILGLTEEQVEELKLVDEWGNKCIPSGGSRENKDPMGRRNGKQPMEKMTELLEKTVNEATEAISKKWVLQGKALTRKDIWDQLDILRGATMIVYPMGLPPHDPIRMELENREDLAGTQDSLSVLCRDETELWFCGKQIFTAPGALLKDFIGKNEKTKVVVKLQKKGCGPPAREPLMTEDEQKKWMQYAYRKQQEHKKLEEDEDDSCYNSPWSDSAQLKRQFQGLNNISWKPK